MVEVDKPSTTPPVTTVEEVTNPTSSITETAGTPHDPEGHRRWRSDLLKANLLAWQCKPTPHGNLDSNIKKHTAFIKKCRVSLTSANATVMVREVNQLKLEKYVTEVVAALAEGILKCKTSPNVMAAVEVISALHQRFSDSFTPELFETFRRLLATPKATPASTTTAGAGTTDRDEASRLLRQRTILRVTTEVWLAGVFWGIENGLSSKIEGATDHLATLLTTMFPTTPTDTTPLLAPIPTPTLSTTGPPAATLKNNRLGLVYHCIKDLLPYPKDKFHNASLAVSFLKSFGEDLLGITPTTTSATPTPSQHHPTLVTEEHREAFLTLFTGYSTELVVHLTREHKAVQREERVNQERYIARGEIHEDTKARYELHFKTYEKHLQLMQSIAECLEIEMPDLPQDSNDPSLNQIVVSDSHVKPEDDNVYESGPWEDDDARMFYEKILDLKTLVPSMLLGNAGTKPSVPPTTTTAHPDQEGKEATSSPEETTTELKEELTMEMEEGEEETEEDLDDLLDQSLTLPDSEEVVDGKATLSVSAQMTLFLTRLQNLANRDLVDQAAVDFCYLSNKASLHRLTQNLIQVPAPRLDLLSHYARFIATLHPYFPDILTGVESALTKEFRILFRKKTSNPVPTKILERRVKNARYLGELTKFRLLPSHFVFFLLKSLLEGFTLPGHAETLCAYLEVCGRFLSKSPETAVRTNTMLETMMKKKAVLHLDERLSLMIENAFYQCHPPSQSAIVKRDRTPLEQFIRKLLRLDLPTRSLDKVLRTLRKLNWEDREVTYRTLRNIFTKIHKSPFAHLPSLATLLGGLTRYHPEFVVEVIDQLLEDIRMGLETNHYRDCQKRIAQVKYLAELYNYRVLESPVIFDTLYFILTFGYVPGQMVPGSLSPLDPPDDYFRIRLCCTILDSCGTCFDRGQNKIRLDGILTFLQVYILYKSPVPLDVQFSISDTFECLRPKLALFTTFDQAWSAFETLRKHSPRFSKELFAPFFQNDPNAREPGLLYPESDSEESLHSDLASRSGSSTDDSDYHPDSKEDASDESGDESGEESLENSEEAKVILLKQLQNEEERAQRQREEEEFEKEYQLMMTSTLEARRYERKATVLDVPIPMKLLDKQAPVFTNGDGSNVAFTLLTKRGNKQQTKTMAIPSDSNLVINTLNKQRADQVEKQQLKDIVLSLEENFDKEEERDFHQDLAQRGIRVLPTRHHHPSGRAHHHPPTTTTSNPASSSPRPTHHWSNEPNTIRASDFGLKSRHPRHPPRGGGGHHYHPSPSRPNPTPHPPTTSTSTTTTTPTTTTTSSDHPTKSPNYPDPFPPLS